MNACIAPSVLTGSLAAPASKSDAHRSLILAALCEQPTTIRGNGYAEDIQTTLRCIESLGAHVAHSPGGYTVCRGPRREEATLDCGESGSTLRFLLPVAAQVCDLTHFTGEGRLPMRPLAELIRCMEAHGARFDADRLPLTVSGGLLPGVYELPGHISSQYVSGLLMALPLCEGDSEIRLTSPLESVGYVDMTLASMKRFSVEATRSDTGFLIPGGRHYRSPGALDVEGDWSGAAFFLAAGALGGAVTVRGLANESLQKDRGIVDCLRLFGANVAETAGCVSVTPGTLRGIEVDVSDMPDIAPILAVVAAFARGETRITGAARLSLKESDRLASVCAMLRALGGEAEELPGAMVIRGKTKLAGGVADSFLDHRIAMAAAIASIGCTAEVCILGAECCAKSYPAFFDEFTRLGGNVHGLEDR